MCFSAPVSFFTGSFLVGIGAASGFAAKKHQRILVPVPFFFGIQQILEGIQWVVTPGSAASIIVGYGFLFFAFLVWPVYAPLAVFIIDEKKRHITRWFLLLGVMVATFFVALLLIQPFLIAVGTNHIGYIFDVTSTTLQRHLLIVLYVIAVCGPMLTSSMPLIRRFGIILFFSGAASRLLFSATFTSVWCFFAAALSALMYVFIRLTNRKK